MTDDALTTIPTTRPNPSPHTLRNRIGRSVWNIVQATLFRWSPKPCHRWRAFLLKCFGANVHPKARVYPKAKIWYPKNLTLAKHATLADDVDCYCVAPISIGESTTISQYTYLCAATHDFDVPEFPLVPLPITIGSRVWIAADCFVGPGLTIGDGAVVGARSSVFKDLEPWGVYAGSPTKRLRDRGFGPGSPNGTTEGA
jgi:putative colanic acid biosynthesis acetyltransferase WcaF